MKPRVVLSVGNFFFGIFATLVVYIILPYLTTFMPGAVAGLVIAAGAFIACCIFPFLPQLVRHYGAQQLALVFAVFEMLALFALAAAPGAFAAAFFVAVAIAVQPLMAYELDLLLEATVEEEGTTGRVRTLFLTAWNIAALGAPLVTGALLASGDAYARVFLAAAAALVPFLVLFAARTLPRGAAPRLAKMRETLRCVVRDRDLLAVSIGHLLLYLFYVWAPFYVPVYLHEVLGIPWSELGWLFSLMLVPFVLIEYPAGWIADKFLGDQEMMFAGFVLMGASLAFVGLMTPATPLAAIAATLIVSRAGAALVESMTEGHFFRRVSEKDVNSVSIFRGIWPLADLVAPLLGSLLLLMAGYEVFFFITGGFLLVAGVMTTLFIRDFAPHAHTRAIVPPTPGAS